MAPQAQPNAAMQNNILFQPMAPQPTAHPVPPFQNMPSLNSSDDEFSSSDDSSSSSSSSSDRNFSGDVSSPNLLSSVIGPAPKSSEGNLISITASSGFAPVPEVKSGVPYSAFDDLKGLVIAPIALTETKLGDPDIEKDSSAWIQVVRPELCSGLSVQLRYLRGPTRAHELQLKNVDPSKPCTICAQLQFQNM
jgi:hypothetical protein